ncbi:MAG: aminotransferase class I/II-fold pyridoxal phosphate-dependent enzyme [Reyranella sp.]|uniref:aminotransferase class I/II-fold pyridoxal phosphate-dependent enzyme n=1 Tax=Reyranella sp. TaxID=1929291 RepID=UPI003D0D8F8C
MNDSTSDNASLSALQKRALLEKLLRERGRPPARRAARGFQIPPEYAALRQLYEGDGVESLGDLFLQSFDGINADRARRAGTVLDNFCSYNYLGMSGDQEVSRAAIDAIATFGTSVSASRLVSGERPVHRRLERGIAQWIGAEDAIVFVGGFSANVDTIGHLLGKDDLIVYDSLIHASVQQGARLAGAMAVPFPHNNLDALDNILRRRRRDARQALIVVEGVYSMDGDIPDLTRLVDIKTRADALLMVDEAHSMGVLGRTGRGIAEHSGVPAGAVDLWMGTLSKSFASCGGYIAGSSELVTYLRHTAPGFVYSVGMTPANAAAALAALGVLQREPERVQRLQARARLFHVLARRAGLDLGTASPESAVVPVIVGESRAAVRLSHALLAERILALPIGFPAVAENKARLRFFVSSAHSEDQIGRAVDAVARNLGTSGPA